jgi:hypothetical protein
MADQRIILRTLTLERAIRTVMHDLRIPKKLRTALSVYQDQRGDMDRPGCCGCETDWVPCGPSYEPPAMEREIKICLRHDDELLDWSIEIDGQRHEHVTSEVMEALVECALIVAQMSLTRALTSTPQ